MEFIQLNHGWNAEPAAPDVKLQIIGSDLTVSFYMNMFLCESFIEEDIGLLTFYNCLQYRLGPPNDEGFYIYGKDRYKRHGIKWGEFYLVKDSNWQVDFPDPKVIGDFQDVDKFNHYLFYFKDETFECIAGSYTFSISHPRTQ